MDRLAVAETLFQKGRLPEQEQEWLLAEVKALRAALLGSADQVARLKRELAQRG
jgi:hypothetical protein